MRVKALAQAIEQGIEAQRGQPLATVALALVDLQLAMVKSNTQAWAAMFLLERLVSTPEAYRKHYARFVALWQQALAAASDPPEPARLPAIARMVHATVYGCISQALLTQGHKFDGQALRREFGLAIPAYLHAGFREPL